MLVADVDVHWLRKTIDDFLLLNAEAAEAEAAAAAAASHLATTTPRRALRVVR